MKHGLSLLWRYSLWITFPLAFAGVFWLTQAFTTWWTFGVQFDAGSFNYSLDRTVRETADSLALRTAHELTIGSEPPPEFRTIDLLVDDRSIATLDAHPPSSGFSYVEAMLQDDNGFAPVEVRYRGDFLIHWSQPKKSWRVKTKRDQLFHGMRRFNLIAPKFGAQANNLLGYRLAANLGLVVPHHELVWLRINGTVRGLHLLVEQLDESTLRNNRRMPGDVWVGELVAKDEWTGVTPRVFEHPGLWEKAAVNNHFPVEADGAIRKLAGLVNSAPDPEVHAALGELIDLEAFARFSALEVLIQYYHTAPSHNWRLYYDPWRARFEPIPWDTNAWAGNEIVGFEPPIGFDPNVTRLHEMLLCDARFLVARQRILTNWFQRGEDVRWRQETEALTRTLHEVVARDPDLRPPRVPQVRVSLRYLPIYMEWVFGEIRRFMLGVPTEVRWATVEDDAAQWSCVVGTTGRQPIVQLAWESEQPIPTPKRVEIEVERSTGVQRIDVTGRVQQSADGKRLVLDAPLTGALRAAPRFIRGQLKVYRHEPVLTTYRVHLLGVPAATSIERLRVTCEELKPRRNLAVEHESRSGKSSLVPRQQQLAMQPADTLYGLKALHAPGKTDVVWSGVVELEGHTTITRSLLIAAGTEVRLAQGACLFLDGPVHATGTAAAPIRFVAADDAPWGTVALRGVGASDSRLDHCVFERGSGYTSPDQLAEYTGMFSIHDVQDVVLRNCAFVDAQIVDDAVHAVYSSLKIIDCRFERANADAVDLDMSDASLFGCTFVASGNDGLDLMTSTVAVEQCTFIGSGDKGISVGERSTLFVTNSTFERCVVGVQAKDGSAVWIESSAIERCGLGFDAFRKNWRYGATGHIFATGCRFAENRNIAATKQDGRIQLVGAIGDTFHPTAGTGSGVEVAATLPTRAVDVAPRAAAMARAMRVELAQ